MNSASQTNRLITLDAARFFAALGVIWIHVCQTPEAVTWVAYGRFAVPFFAAAAGYLLVGSLSKPSPIKTFPFLKSRIQRLYLPFLCWSLIYAAAGWAKARLTGESPQPLSWELLYVGGAYHLWFIPFLIVASLCGYAACRYVGCQQGRETVAAGFAYLLGLLLALILDQLPVVDSPLHYMAMTTPALLWGVALGWLGAVRDWRTRAENFPMISVIAACCFTIIMLQIQGLNRSALGENATGATLLLTSLFAAKLVRTDVANWCILKLGKLGTVSLGIYFSHLLFVKFGEAVFDKFAIAGAGAEVLILMILSSVAAIFLSLIAARYRATRWLVC